VPVARQRNGEHVSAASNEHRTIYKLLEAVFSIRPIPRSTDQPAEAVLSCIVTSQNLATTSEQTEDVICEVAVVIYTV
jgi:hypothetical protein